MGGGGAGRDVESTISVESRVLEYVEPYFHFFIHLNLTVLN
jgi:hypothetical protein